MKAASNENDNLALILNGLLDGIIIVGKEGKIKYANKSALKLFNLSSEALIGSDFGFVIVPEKMHEIQIVQEQKILFVQMLASTVKWEEEPAFLISLRNVSALKKQELALQMERQKLEQTNIELSQYASMASHDLREPVRKILVYSQRLNEKYSGQIPAEPFKIFEKMRKSGQRLSAIIEGISKFTNIQKFAINAVPVDLNQVINQVVDDLEILIIEKKAHVDAGNLPTVMGETNLLNQLFLNLISNSIKYSREEIAPVITISGKPVKAGVEISLKDNGLGFESKFAQRIFEPFERLHTDLNDGTGMGLAICKRIVEAHKGDISAESEPGKGTTFTIHLPK